MVTSLFGLFGLGPLLLFDTYIFPGIFSIIRQWLEAALFRSYQSARYGHCMVVVVPFFQLLKQIGLAEYREDVYRKIFLSEPFGGSARISLRYKRFFVSAVYLAVRDKIFPGIRTKSVARKP